MSAPRLTAEQKKDIVRRYQAREPIASIAERYGCDPSYPGLLAKRKTGKRRTISQAVQDYWRRRFKSEAAQT